MASRRSEQTERLISLLGKGEGQAVSREQLAVLMGMPDRKMREVVAYARLEGACIANAQDGRGYYIPENLDEYKKQYRQTANRGKKILAQLKALRYAIADLEDKDQLELEALLEGEV